MPKKEDIFPIDINECNIPSRIAGYKAVEISQDLIDKYKEDYKTLLHISISNKYSGIILLHDKEFVAILNVNLANGFIQALFVNDDYRRKGIASELLKAAIKNYSCKHLTVNKMNKTAISLYKKEKWKKYDESEYMYFMEHN